MGLLTKRGMDYFPQVYDEYSKDGSKKPDFDFSSELRAKIGDQIVESAKDAIKIVGVWETVGFHAEGMLGEQFEFHVSHHEIIPDSVPDQPCTGRGTPERLRY